MDWGLLQTILTIIFGVVAVISIIVAIKLARQKKPAWAYTTTKIIGLGSDAPSELKLIFNDITIPDVYKTTFIFYNRGNETIRKEDINEAITIHLKNGELLRDPYLQAASRPQIRLSTIKRGDDSVEIDFSYLDKNDGGVIELLHTKYDEINCNGDIMGVGRPLKLSEFENKPPRYKIPRVFLFMMLLGLPVILTVVILFLPLGEKEPTSDNTVWILVGGIWLLWLAQSIMKLWPDYRYLKFPKWSRFKDEEATN